MTNTTSNSRACPPVALRGRGRAGLAATAVCLAVLATPRLPAADDGAPAGTASTAGFAGYLATWQIDRGGRGVLEEAGEWTPAKQMMAVRVLARLGRMPGNLAARWNAEATPLSALPPGERIVDRLVRVEGRAVFVSEPSFSAEEAAVVGHGRVRLVRIVTADDLAVDVLADHVPDAWPRAVPIDEPAAAVGLPLSAAGGPPAAAGGGAAAVLLAAAAVAWFPATPLGSLGMDYGLFDGVVDGQKLVAGDTEAFYGLLAAAGRAARGEIEAAAGPPGDIVPLIDPSRDWFARHRGDPFTVEGIARRATRIAVDDPLRRAQVGADHYWELFVFVPTPLIRINDRLQEDYPVVCCVRTLPAGMPTGQRIGERVRISGFALKRYGYPLPDVKISSSQGESSRAGLRQETALLVAAEATWLPRPPATREVDTLGWVFLGIAAAVGLGLAVAAWSFAREAARREKQGRSALPDRIDLP